MNDANGAQPPESVAAKLIMVPAGCLIPRSAG